MKSPLNQAANKALNLFLSISFLTTQIFPVNAFAAETLLNPATAQPAISLQEAQAQTQSPAPQASPTSLDSLGASALTAATPQRVIEVRPGQDLRTVLNQAQSGDKILIYAGRYTNPVNNNYILSYPTKTNITVEGVPDAGGNRPVIEGYTFYLSDGMTVSNLEIKPPSASPQAASPLILSHSHNVTIKNVKTSSITGYGDSTLISDCEITAISPDHINNTVSIFGNDNRVENTKMTGYGQIVRLNGDRNTVSKSVMRSLAPSKGISCAYIVRGVCMGATVVDNVEPLVDINGLSNTLSQNTIAGYGSTNPGNSGVKIYGTGNKILNTIIANMAVAIDAKANTEIRYSLLQSQSAMTNLTAGPGLLLNQDPRFVNLAAGDFHLQSNSPAISAGDPSLPQDEFGTPAEIGAFSFDRAAVVDQVEVLPTVAQVFSTAEAALAYMQSKSIASFSLAEILALKPVVSPGRAVNGNFLVMMAGPRSAAVSFSGEVQTFNCFVAQGITHCILSGISSTSKTLWKASGYPDVTISSSKLLRTGMTPEGRLVLQAEHGSITVYKFGGGVQMYARAIVIQNWTQVPGTHYATQLETSATHETLKLLDTNMGVSTVIATNALSSGMRLVNSVHISPDHTPGGPVLFYATTQSAAAGQTQVNLGWMRITGGTPNFVTVMINNGQNPLGQFEIAPDGTLVVRYSSPISTGGALVKEIRVTPKSTSLVNTYTITSEHLPSLSNPNFEFRESKELTNLTSSGYRSTLEVINKTTGVSTVLFDERTFLEPTVGFQGGTVSPDGKWVAYEVKSGIFIKSVENPSKVFSLLEIAGGTLSALGHIKAVRFPDADTIVVDTTTRTGISVSTLSLPGEAVPTASNPNFYFVYERNGTSVTRLVLYKKIGNQVTKQVLLANNPALSPLNKVDVSPDGLTVIYATRQAINKDNGQFKHWEETIYVQNVLDPSRKLVLTETVQAYNSSPLVINELRYEGNIVVIKSKKPTKKVNMTTLKIV